VDAAKQPHWEKPRRTRGVFSGKGHDTKSEEKERMKKKIQGPQKKHKGIKKGKGKGSAT